MIAPERMVGEGIIITAKGIRHTTKKVKGMCIIVI